MKKLSSLLLVLVLALGLVACDQGRPDDGSSQPADSRSQLLGKWGRMEKVGTALDEILRFEGFPIHGPDLEYAVTMELREDGTVVTDYDRAAAQTALAEARTQIIRELQIHEADILQDKGAGLEEYIDSLLAVVDPEAMGLVSSGYYKVEGNRLYISDTQSFAEENAFQWRLDVDRLVLEGPGRIMTLERVGK